MIYSRIAAASNYGKGVTAIGSEARVAVVTRDGVTIGLTVAVAAPARHVKVVVYDPLQDRIGSAS